MDSLMFGVLISWWWNLKATASSRAWLARHGRLAVLTGALFFIPAFIWSVHLVPWISVFGLVLFYLGGGLMVLGALSATTFAGGFWTRIANLGKQSYSVYLWNGMVYDLIVEKFRTSAGGHWNNYWEFAASFSLSWIIGIAAAKLFEVPFLKLRERYLPAKPKGPTPSS